jgi:hypothetical protein
MTGVVDRCAEIVPRALHAATNTLHAPVIAMLFDLHDTLVADDEATILRSPPSILGNDLPL